MNTSTSILLMVGLAIGCKNPPTVSDVGKPNPPDMIPMSKTSTWYYDVSVYDSNGVKFNSYQGFASVERDTIIGSDHWYYYSQRGFRTNRADGVWQTTIPGIARLEFSKTLKDSCYTETQSIITCLATDSVITVPYGARSTFFYSERDTTHDELARFTFIAPGLGIIREDYFVTTRPGGKRYLEASAELSSIVQ